MSGIVRTSTYDSAGYNLAVSWSVQSQSVSNNSTTLSYRVFTDNNRYSNTWIMYHQTSVRINGTTVYSRSDGFKGYKNQTLKTGTITIPHNSDGTKSINISLSTNMYYANSNTKTGSQTITLPTINRGIYDVSLASGWSDLDGPKRITFKKYNSNTTVKVRWEYWSNATNSKKGEYIIRDTNGNSLADSYTSGTSFKFQDDLITAIHNDKPNYKEASVYITIRSYVGSSLIQTINRTVNLKLKVEAPDISTSVSFIGRNQNLLGNSKRGLVGVHQLRVVINGSAKNGANIRNYEVTYDGKTYTSTKNTFTINASTVGSKTVESKVTDTRGFLRITSDTVQVLPYKKPTVRHRAYRMDGSTEDPLGETARISGNVIIDDVKNASGSSVNSAFWSLDVDGNTTRNTASIMYSERLSRGSSKSYVLKYGDKFTESIIVGTIPEGKAPLAIEEESVGVNMVPPKGSKGLYIRDGLINGQSVLTYSKYTGFTGGDFEYMAETIRRNAEDDSLNYATLITSTTAGYGVLYVFNNKTRAVGTIYLYTWNIRRVEYADGTWTVIKT